MILQAIEIAQIRNFSDQRCEGKFRLQKVIAATTDARTFYINYFLEYKSKNCYTHNEKHRFHIHIRAVNQFTWMIFLQLQGTLYAAVYDSPVAHGKIKSLDLSAAEKSEGVVRIFTYKDITGENQIGGIVPDEPLLAEDIVHFCGMPVALVVAETTEHARAAVKKIKM